MDTTTKKSNKIVVNGVLTGLFTTLLLLLGLFALTIAIETYLLAKIPKMSSYYNFLQKNLSFLYMPLTKWPKIATWLYPGITALLCLLTGITFFVGIANGAKLKSESKDEDKKKSIKKSLKVAYIIFAALFILFGALCLIVSLLSTNAKVLSILTKVKLADFITTNKNFVLVSGASRIALGFIIILAGILIANKIYKSQEVAIAKPKKVKKQANATENVSSLDISGYSFDTSTSQPEVQVEEPKQVYKKETSNTLMFQSQYVFKASLTPEDDVKETLQEGETEPDRTLVIKLKNLIDVSVASSAKSRFEEVKAFIDQALKKYSFENTTTSWTNELVIFRYNNLLFNHKKARLLNILLESEYFIKNELTGKPEYKALYEEFNSFVVEEFDNYNNLNTLDPVKETINKCLTKFMVIKLRLRAKQTNNLSIKYVNEKDLYEFGNSLINAADKAISDENIQMIESITTKLEDLIGKYNSLAK
ncbi:hypothetical protein PUW95_01960 [Metamycoplasma hyosynoviae]|uniref:Uncharacterized protein n=1 Tax=Metamycoplasma hyosynoviae TaxID=29559 RepID=A0A4P1QG53_9BACT|nr:hypothetical protein [Metamycoplasma hyosynoviae]ASI53872.1 hypothetical protein MHSN_01510 [Metamycoplasma hyosynoviae]MDD1360298.1 hypothetical protein [Metamycoplasma hyosynoviae]MDD7897494.1 hypothetical protein [Metamycoplasma hyosynoviae]